MKRRDFIASSAALMGLTANAQVVDLNDAINKAGRQRMLSQRMAKFYLANTLQVDPQGSTAEIGKARTEFLAAMDTLRKAPEATTKIRDELTLADSQWVFFDQGLQRLAGTQQSP